MGSGQVLNLFPMFFVPAWFLLITSQVKPIFICFENEEHLTLHERCTSQTQLYTNILESFDVAFEEEDDSGPSPQIAADMINWDIDPTAFQHYIQSQRVRIHTERYSSFIKGATANSGFCIYCPKGRRGKLAFCANWFFSVRGIMSKKFKDSKKKDEKGGKIYRTGMLMKPWNVRLNYNMKIVRYVKK